MDNPLHTPTETRVLSRLYGLGIDFELLETDPAFADTAAFCEKYDYPVHHSCNTILVASRKGPLKYAACNLLAGTRLDVNKKVKKLMGVSKASFAPSDQMRQLTGMEVGGVTPFALSQDISLYVDQRVMKLPWVLMGSGGRNFKIKITPNVFTLMGAQIVVDLALDPHA